MRRNPEIGSRVDMGGIVTNYHHQGEGPSY